MKRIVVVTVAVFLLGFVLHSSALAVKTDRGTFGPRAIGEFAVFVEDGNGWREIGRLPYNRFVRERVIDLSRILKGKTSVKVRLVQRGGGAAHVDAVSLGNVPPVRVHDDTAGTVLKKLSQCDLDVTDASGKTLEMVFPVKSPDMALRLTARVEAEIVRGSPFQFPVENLRRQIDSRASFYDYQLNSRVGKDAGLAEPFFKEYCRAGTGHPHAYTYGWVWNDKENLYVKIDFTGDNTMDGDEDYAKVFVNGQQKVKEFKVSVP